MGEATPYQLKGAAADPTWDFWTIPHAQLYSEPQRLAEAGYLSERRESGGRRRKHYKVTEAGVEALHEWLAEPEPSTDELRELAFVKLLFGADPKWLAKVQLPAHRDRLNEYEKSRESLTGSESSGIRTALEAGIANERLAVRFWQRVIDDEDLSAIPSALDSA
jgi:DNA-binding PadR family transcriptional regulator